MCKRGGYIHDQTGNQHADDIENDNPISRPFRCLRDVLPRVARFSASDGHNLDSTVTEGGSDKSAPEAQKLARVSRD
jgi:hypothetical protein